MSKNKNENLVDKLLESNKGKFSYGLVIGVTPDGMISIDSTNNNYPTVVHVLNRALFEVMLHEKSAIMSSNKAAETESAAINE